ncbi:MAG: hypothetical protein K6G16_07430 [Lachnospiraceae bacterium]|nr:hypothetical protein [Lachnospiraceae bacterium]
MGQLVEGTCKNCGKKWELRLGYGLMHGRAADVAALFPSDVRRELPLEEMRRMDVPWSFAYEPAVCAYCRDIVTVPVLRVGKEGTEYVGGCSVCGGAAERVPREELEKAKCPDCGQAGLRIRDAGVWD